MEFFKVKKKNADIFHVISKQGVYMEYNNEYDENQLQHIKIQQDLIDLIRVIDDCMEEMDKFYFYAMKRRMLAGSTDN